VDKVTFSVDGNEIASMSSGPYKTTYDTAGLLAGSKLTIKVEIKDDNGNNASDSESVSL